MFMTVRIRPALPALIIVSAIFLAGAGATGFAQAMTTSVDGTVVSLTSAMLTLTAPDGSTKTVALGPSTLVLERSTATLSDVSKGDAMGVTTHRAEDGSMVATAINIFSPELYKVVRKGQFPMQQPGQIMTNAVVDAYESTGDGHSLTMSYNGETYPITVPDSAEIHRLITVSRDTVKAGMHVLVRGSQGSDGTVKAAVVSFDAQG